ncbi:MAG TPA: GGDEF domain-containing protein [Rhodocyclaceae bacterium]|nr:GGDEF domain-containing protein [Rhodocyclaceae bacterium]
MLRYRDSIEKSAEYLRLALPLMSKQAAALHPISYAVWYDYVSGANAALRAEVDRHITTGTPLDEATTETLFRRYIAELNEETARRVGDGFQRVLADISHTTNEAGEQANLFGDALEQWREGLAASLPDLGFDIGAEALLQDTQRMQRAIGTLGQRLEDSRQEIERLKAEVSRAREDALRDALTGLINRRGFDLSLASALEGDHPGHGPSLLMTDIDHFKAINDRFGHLFGDKVIRAIGVVLKDNVKGRDVAARYGGEEFAILLPDTPLEGARTLAEKLRGMIAASRIRRTDNNAMLESVTVSIGVACYKPAEPAESLVRRADLALYASKQGGRNRVTVASAR